MGKQGPCCHCGVTSTPLWRNGPPEKPVLCNACGSRWRTRGSLTKYMPLHTRGTIDSEGLKTIEVKAVRSISFKSKQQKLPQKKKDNDTFGTNKHELPFSDQNFQKIVEGDTGNRSSSTSAISYSESCAAHHGTAHATDLAGSSISDVLVSVVPSKKRTCIGRAKPSPVERLAKDLCSIMHEQQSSCISGTLEDDLIYQDGATIDSFETGYGSVLLRHPNSESIEEESEASSVPVNNSSDVCLEPEVVPLDFKSKEPSFLNADSSKLEHCTAELAQDTSKRNKYTDNTLQIMHNKDSLLASIDLKDVVSFQNFESYFTLEEQQQLLKFLPSVDTVNPPTSIKSMFSTSQFVETLSYFEKLLREEAFGLSFLQVNSEECWRLEGLLLGILNKSRWVEFYEQLKEKNCRQKRGEEMVAGSDDPRMSVKRPYDGETHSSTDLIDTMRSPERACRAKGTHLPSRSSSETIEGDTSSKYTDDAAVIDTEGAFAPPPDLQSMLAPLQYTDDGVDHVSLQDSGCNAPFARAGVRHNHSKKRSVRHSSQVESANVN